LFLAAALRLFERDAFDDGRRSGGGIGSDVRLITDAEFGWRHITDEIFEFVQLGNPFIGLV